jgi:Ethanolamine utilization protein EutJ (predicted chaperonin)
MGRTNRRHRVDLSSATTAAMEVAPPSLENPTAISELLLARGGVAVPVGEGGAGGD